MVEVQLLVLRNTRGCQTPSEGRDLLSDNETEGDRSKVLDALRLTVTGRCLLHIIQKYWSTKIPSSFNILSFFPWTRK